MVLRNIPPYQRRLVKYEDLCDHPEQVLRSLCGFLGLEYPPDMPELRYDKVHSLPGSPMLFERSTIIKKDVRWRVELTGDDLDEFESIAGSLNRSFGYG